jgi:hypothetical protein
VPRGFRWASYVTDDGTLYATKVDADYFDQVERGWSNDGVELLPVLPRGALPRRVVGIDEQGDRRYAICASTDADLWVGLVDAFTFEANDNELQLATVVGRQQEVIPRPRLP